MPCTNWVITMTSDDWVTGHKEGYRGILATLIELLEDQENVKIAYEFETSE